MADLDYNASDVLLDELLRHALARILGNGTGDAVVNENKARSEIANKKERSETQAHGGFYPE